MASGINDSTYAAETNELMSLLSDLNELGINRHINLPGIVVVGIQSAGKSSLVEAISKIEVPKDAGTCTRCAINITMSPADEWSYDFSIKQPFDRRTGLPLDVEKEDAFGVALKEREKVPERISRAQYYLLLPSLSSNDALTLPLDELKWRFAGKEEPVNTFSKNTIRLVVRGPGITHLIFTDLPGVISTAAKGEEEMVPLVEDLVVQHMRKQYNLILLTMPINVDINNQKSYHLALEADRSGKRRIGVLTKPDEVQHEEQIRKTWLKIFLNSKDFHLDHGYFVTKQPGYDVPRSDSWDKEEYDWLRRTEPWKSEVSAHGDRMGVLNLIQFMSKLLSGMVKEQLPRIRDDVDRKLRETQLRLRALPPPSHGNELLRLQKFFMDISTRVQNIASAATGHQRLIRRLRNTYSAFEEDIKGCRPRFNLLTDFGGGKAQTIDAWLGDTHVVYLAHSSPPSPIPREPATPSESDDGAVDTARPNFTWGTMNLSAIKNHIADSRGRELPYSIPYEAKRSLIERSVEHWNEIASYHLAVAKAEVENAFIDEVHFALRDVYHDDLQTKADDVVLAQSSAFHSVTTQFIKDLVEAERSPFTLNLHYFSKTRQKVKDLASPALMKPYEEEIEVVADVLAYWKIAYKRIIDNFALAIDQKFLRPLAQSIHEALLKKFSFDSMNDTVKQEIVQMLEDNPAHERERVKLNDLQKKLLEAQRRIKAFDCVRI
ncbi:P-loop containing nucleoside triphosphate hydrolase protein [Atractiella rhizophila]|nr:P-loop containing nucleoside triphosphate hydrolase protein [Atractiella rhizophila]